MSDTAPEKRAEIAALYDEINALSEVFRTDTITPKEQQIAALQAEIEAIEEACGHSTLEQYDDGGVTKYRCASVTCQKDFGVLR